MVHLMVVEWRRRRCRWRCARRRWRRPIARIVRRHARMMMIHKRPGWRWLWTPNSHRAIVRARRKHRRIDWIPAHTIHRTRVSGECEQWLFTLHMPNQHRAVFAAARNEALIHAAKAREDRVVGLHIALEDTHEHLIAKIPQVQTLLRDIQ